MLFLYYVNAKLYFMYVYTSYIIFYFTVIRGIRRMIALSQVIVYRPSGTDKGNLGIEMLLRR